MTTHSRVGIVCSVVLLGLWGTAGRALAQSNDLTVFAEANGGSVKMSVKVNLPPLGWVTVPLSVPPIAQATLGPGGGTVHNEVADVNANLLGVPVLAVRGVSNDVGGSAPGPVVEGAATSHVAEATLLNGLVLVKKLVAHVHLTAESVPGASPELSVAGRTFVQELVVAGITVPLGEIAPNTTLPLLGELPLPILGPLGLTVPVPISATVTLNEQVRSPQGLEVNAVRVKGKGNVSGLAQLSVDIILGGPEVSAEEKPPFVCPVDDITNTQCMGPKDCLYPHPDICTQFIHCEVNADGQTGRPTVKDCPPDLEWNDNDKICDSPASSTCPRDPPPEEP
ncbi:MAG: choice-of-anchor P family protein [Gammaproteobacteria bacterium]